MENIIEDGIELRIKKHHGDIILNGDWSNRHLSERHQKLIEWITKSKRKKYTYNICLNPANAYLPKENYKKNKISGMKCTVLEIEGLLGRPPGLCYSYFVGEGLDIVIYRVVTHPSPINNIG